MEDDDSVILNDLYTDLKPVPNWVKFHSESEWITVKTRDGDKYYKRNMKCADGRCLYQKKTRIEAMQAGHISSQYKDTDDNAKKNLDDELEEWENFYMYGGFLGTD